VPQGKGATFPSGAKKAAGLVRGCGKSAGLADRKRQQYRFTEEKGQAAGKVRQDVGAPSGNCSVRKNPNPGNAIRKESSACS